MRRRYLTIIIGVLIVAAIIGVGITQLQGKAANTYSADVIAALSSGDTAGFARAVTVKEFKFPQDFGAHPEFQTEWWYYTGSLAAVDGRRFGYEFTIFRRALAATKPERASEWGTNQIYFADLALTDVQGGQFYSRERFARGAAGLAGAVTDPNVRVWIEDWAMDAQSPDASTMHLRAADGPIALDLTVKQTKPPTLQGDHGLSAKSSEPGNASYYYSLTRLDTTGTLTVNGTPYTISGTSWKDHEYSTSVLSKNAVGWDWFSLQLDDQREIMLYRIRRADGTYEPTSDGTLINADGSTERLTLADYQIEELTTWHSNISGATYPAKWRITIKPKTGEPILITVEPLLADQELHSTTAYWEGTSRISGTQGSTPLSGYGYVELTGYNPTVAADSQKLNRSSH